VATTALVVEILIVGLEFEAVLALVVFAVFGWDWLDFGGLSDWIAPLTIGAFALGYVLGVVGDRVADWATNWFRRRRDTPASVPKMRLTVLSKNSELARFLDYQRSRMRVARGTAVACALGAVVSSVTLPTRQPNLTADIFVPVALAVSAWMTVLAFSRIDEAYVARLVQSYRLVTGDRKPPDGAARRVAGICFRKRDGAPEFLLVRLKHRGLRRERPWTFPKGKVKERVDQGDDVAAAKREAEEEAGVTNATDPMFVAVYRYGLPTIEDPEDGDDVNAYLLRVVAQARERRQERFRKPTWFKLEEARVKLGRGRPEWQGREHARVLDEAMVRLARLD
jgi:8-oxo-dGTP pyrophosphatase MutT (NUDIX family)